MVRLCFTPLHACKSHGEFTIVARIFESTGRVDTGGHFEFPHMCKIDGYPAPQRYGMTLFSAVGYQSTADQRRSNPPPYFRGARDLLNDSVNTEVRATTARLNRLQRMAGDTAVILSSAC